MPYVDAWRLARPRTELEGITLGHARFGQDFTFELYSRSQYKQGDVLGTAPAHAVHVTESWLVSLFPRPLGRSS